MRHVHTLEKALAPRMLYFILHQNRVQKLIKNPKLNDGFILCCPNNNYRPLAISLVLMKKGLDG